MQTTKLTTVLVLTGLFLGLMVPSVAAWGSSGGEGAQADQEQGNQGLLGFSFAVTDQDNTQRATQRGSSRASGGSGDDNVVSINDQDLTQDSDQRASTFSFGGGFPW